MAILPFAYYESLKRYWRRKKYQRISNNGATLCKKKLKIARLGVGGAAAPRRLSNRRQHLKLVSPIKLLAKFHDAYAGMMICLANKIANSKNNGGLFRGKKVAKSRQVSSVSSGEEVDCKLLVEIYKKIAASRQLSTY